MSEFNKGTYYQKHNTFKPFALTVSKYANELGTTWNLEFLHEDLKPRGCWEYNERTFDNVDHAWEFIDAKLGVLAASKEIQLTYDPLTRARLFDWLITNFE